MNFADITLTCRECGMPFVFTAGEQEFYQSKGLQNQPSRCSSCRTAARRSAQAAPGTSSRPRERFQTVCAACGGPALVPFVPRHERPVYCSNCYDKVRAEAAVPVPAVVV